MPSPECCWDPAYLLFILIVILLFVLIVICLGSLALAGCLGRAGHLCGGLHQFPMSINCCCLEVSQLRRGVAQGDPFAACISCQVPPAALQAELCGINYVFSSMPEQSDAPQSEHGCQAALQSLTADRPVSRLQPAHDMGAPVKAGTADDASSSSGKSQSRSLLPTNLARFAAHVLALQHAFLHAPL